MIQETPIPAFKRVRPQKYWTPNHVYSQSEVLEFINYCNEFYNESDGIYPIASRKEIIEAVVEYLYELESECQFDSIDRERVRQIIQPEYSMF